MMARKAALALLVSLAMALLAGCMPSSLDLSGEESAQEITVVLGQHEYTMSPYSPVLANRRVGHLVFSGLTRVGYSLAPEPDLIEQLPTKPNGGISPDGKRIVYKLRQDATWHDGKPVTASDVLFTLGLLREGVMTDDPAVDYGNIASASAEDSWTVALTLKRPDSPAAWRFVPFVLPSHLLGSEKDVVSSPFWLAPVGSGPYRYESGVPGQEVRLSPVKAGKGAPLRLVFGADSDAQRQAFDGASAAVWADGPASGAVSESMVETPSTVWQVWLMNTAADRVTSDAALREVLSRVTPVDIGVSAAKKDPWGNDMPKRSVLGTSAAATALEDAGWIVSGATRAKDGKKIDLVIGTPTLLSENDEFVLGYRDKLTATHLRANTFVAELMGLGGFVDADTLHTGRYDIARTTLALDAPYTVGWPFDGDNIPSLQRPFGSNVTRLRDVELDAAARAVRSSGTPEQASRGMKQLGVLLGKTNTVLWDGQLPAQLLTTGVSGVSAHPLAEYALLSAPGWVIGDTNPAR